MPLVYYRGAYVLQCVNRALTPAHTLGPGETTTMLSTPTGEWNAITHVTPAQVQGGGVNFDPSRGIPVRAFVCRSCGYVELYAGSVIEPQTWKHG